MINYFTRHPVAANLVLLAVVYLGLTVIGGMERESFPAFSSDRVTVGISYSGASAADVDDQICVKLDDELGSVSELKEMSCLSIDGKATATLTMNDGGDIGQFYNDVSSATSAISDFPADAEAAQISVASRNDMLAFLAVSGIEDPSALVHYADQLADEISNLSKVATATVSGISDDELLVEFNTQALRRYNVSAKDVSDALSARSMQVPVGQIKTSDRSITVRYTDARRSVEDLEDLIIFQNEGGGYVRVSDLGTVTLVESEENSRSFINGKRAAIIQISKTRDDDAIEAMDQVRSLMAREELRYPDPFEISVVADTTEPVSEQLRIVLQNAAQSMLLVVLVMYLFFSVKEAIWISLALPFSFLAGIFVMSLLGVTINMVTLLGLLMSIGLIMDDSIVIADNISKWRDKVDHKEAAVNGAQEVMSGVVSSFLTTAAVFGPLMFLDGQIGKVLQFIPIVLLITLAASLFEAFFILPNHLSHVHSSMRDTSNRFFPRYLDKGKEAFVLPIVALFVRWRYATVGSIVAVFIVSIGLITSGSVNVIGFPSSEENTIEVRIALTPGLPLEQTEKVAAQLLAALDTVNADWTPKTKDGQDLVKQVLVMYATNADLKNNGSHSFTITVDLLDSDQRNILADDVLELWQQAAGPIPDLMQKNFTQSVKGPGGNDIEIQLSSRDLIQLESAISDLFLLVQSRPDVTSVYQDFRKDRPTIELKLNEYAYTIGLTPQSVTNQLRSAFSGVETDSFKVGLSDNSVRVEISDAVPSITALEDYPITLTGGKSVPLSRIAALEARDSYSQITRENGRVIAKIVGNIDKEATTAGQIAQFASREAWPSISEAYPDVSIDIGGATEEQAETQGSIVTALLTGLVAVYLILAFQFRSYSLPLIIMLSIPFALIGTIYGHLLMGLDISMPSFIGFASLSGVVVNNAILFMTFFESEIKDGDYTTAAIEAVRHRFRPVLLSFLTTFIGLIPITFETSPYVKTLVPLVTSVAFGLLASTLLVIFVFPSLLSIYFDFKSVEKWLKK
ncbi:efflux RND transporter permease subunit [Cohaesibacter celericrescens]|uniref:AcrB/AcrD/AcrF family protein n=1 Tax=Cohaesibacter celericrescens TaxID=2067669 RepID=A0A2N5XX07_9HYPH|nr:efflux RND transporter permease subunit [Cohaesibacter celericrescens]PLW79044.1 hypothetical protein C0081_02080 [Cohaesibacter celericrescens]